MKKTAGYWGSSSDEYIRWKKLLAECLGNDTPDKMRLWFRDTALTIAANAGWAIDKAETFLSDGLFLTAEWGGFTTDENWVIVSYLENWLGRNHPIYVTWQKMRAAQKAGTKQRQEGSRLYSERYLDMGNLKSFLTEPPF